MNLIELLKKKDSLLELSKEYQQADANSLIVKKRVENNLLRGLVFDSNFSITLKRPFKVMPFKEWPEYTDWSLYYEGTEKKLEAFITLTYKNKDIHRISLKTSKQLIPIPLPKPINADHCPSELSLKISVTKVFSGNVFIFIHSVLNRQWLYDLCKGYGVEIGPGPRPQIFPTKDTDVVYVEQKEQAEWSNLYSTYQKKDSDNPDIWKRYKVGEANSLPVEKGSCNFIYSAHVFEHLANPIGHLEYWLSCLKSGGHILAVVPDMAACKDYMMTPSTWDEIFAEYQTGNFKPVRSHYERVKEHGRLGMSVDEAMEKQWSIHVHYYRASQLASFLSRLEQILPIQGWSILNTPNHKDFHFVIKKK